MSIWHSIGYGEYGTVINPENMLGPAISGIIGNLPCLGVRCSRCNRIQCEPGQRAALAPAGSCCYCPNTCLPMSHESFVNQRLDQQLASEERNLRRKYKECDGPQTAFRNASTTHRNLYNKRLADLNASGAYPKPPARTLLPAGATQEEKTALIKQSAENQSQYSKAVKEADQGIRDELDIKVAQSEVDKFRKLRDDCAKSVTARIKKELIPIRESLKESIRQQLQQEQAGAQRGPVPLPTSLSTPLPGRGAILINASPKKDKTLPLILAGVVIGIAGYAYLQTSRH